MHPEELREDRNQDLRPVVGRTDDLLVAVAGWRASLR
jgi:hypothetical protein